MGYAVDLMSRPVARLFHAVVVVGASLAGCGAGADHDEGPAPARAPSSSVAPGLPTSTASPEAASPFDSDTDPVQPATAASDASSDASPVGQADTNSDDPAAEAPPRPARSAMRARPAATMAAPESPRGDACPPGSERPFPPCYFIL